MEQKYEKEYIAMDNWTTLCIVETDTNCGSTMLQQDKFKNK